MTGTLPAGVDGITANYAGDIANGSSVSNPVTETIGAAPGSTVNVQVVSTALAIGIGGTVTITANVRPVVVGPVPTGFVTFLLNGNIVLGAVPVQNIGTAVLTLNTLPPGADRISASYSGDTTYNPANSLAITINVGANVGILADTTDITTSNASVNVGLPITFTATVTPNANGGAAADGNGHFLERWRRFRSGQSGQWRRQTDNINVAAGPQHYQRQLFRRRQLRARPRLRSMKRSGRSPKPRPLRAW